MSKPLAEMDRDEFCDAFALRFGKPDFSQRGFVEVARAGEDQEIRMVFIMLCRLGAPDAIAFSESEYGDGAGHEMCVNIMTEMLEDGELEDGESLYLALAVARELEIVTL